LYGKREIRLDSRIYALTIDLFGRFQDHDFGGSWYVLILHLKILQGLKLTQG
jgi:hypothetical protein